LSQTTAVRNTTIRVTVANAPRVKEGTVSLSGAASVGPTSVPVENGTVEFTVPADLPLGAYTVTVVLGAHGFSACDLLRVVPAPKWEVTLLPFDPEGSYDTETVYLPDKKEVRLRTTRLRLRGRGFLKQRPQDNEILINGVVQAVRWDGCPPLEREGVLREGKLAEDQHLVEICRPQVPSLSRGGTGWGWVSGGAALLLGVAVNDLQKKTAQAIVNIFETGRVHGDYGAVTVLKGDLGHLTYGRSQTTLGSGNLFVLVKAYCAHPDAALSRELRPYLPELAARKMELDHDMHLRAHLREAGEDPVMQETQDRFFDANYFDPALRTASAKGIHSPLGQTVVYDSFIQGGFHRVVSLVGATVGEGGVDEKEWVARYVKAREGWLSRLKPPLPGTVYRMHAFARLIEQKAWELPLDLTVRGVVISPETLADAMPVLRASAVDPCDPTPGPVLYLTSPYQCGPEVVQVQEALNTHGLANGRDGVFGPFTEVLVKRFQESKGLCADGVVGPATRAALGI